MQTDLISKLYDATNAGLDIILHYYPQARETITGKEKHFKIRPESTASAAIKKIKDVYRVTDFGGDGAALSPLDIAMREESLTFTEALYRLADRYGVSTTISASRNKPEIETRPANTDEPEGHFTCITREKPTDAELAVMGPAVKAETMAKYNYFALESYTITRNRKTSTITATEHYPIFMRDCGTFKKIYQPLNPDKAYRFFYTGEKSANYVNGLEEIKKAYSKLLASLTDETEADESTSTTKKPQKLPECIICSGERDALNIAGYGYFPIWLNSETARIDEHLIKELAMMCEKTYNLPDIDETGIKQAYKTALKYIDIYTIELPLWLRTYSDARGKPRKDFRDYIELRPGHQTVKDLCKAAKCCRFWEYTYTKTGRSLQINTINLIHFLKVNGFYTFVDKKTQKITYIRIDQYKVIRVIPKQVRGFILSYLEENNIDQDVQNLFLNSKRSGISVMDDLKEAWFLDFTKATHDSQTLFFQNKAIKVEADKTTDLSRDNLRYVWEEHICKHNFKRTDPAFIVTGPDMDFSIRHTRSNIFKYLINGSRLYWREEFELRQSPDEAENQQYNADNHFNIQGPRLKAPEIAAQIQNLLNKIYAIGYLMHNYKFDSLAMAVWIMENRLSEDGESSGGSGKSYFIKFLKYIKSTVYLDGRNRKLTDNPHMVEEVSEFTDLLWIDDAHQYFDFNSFYGMITSGMTINRKHTSSFQLDYKEAPKMAVTSNFPPPNSDSSTLRRLLILVFSDYYHKKTGENDYNENRSIADDLGKELHNDLYSADEWNDDYNFLIDCLQLYFKCLKENTVIEAPLDNVHKRINIQRMGSQFAEWADVYFSPTSGNCDILLPKIQVMNSFKAASGINNWTSQKFGKAIKAYADNAPHIIKLNPAALMRPGEKRITRRNSTTGQVEEMIYVQTIEKINELD